MKKFNLGDRKKAQLARSHGVTRWTINAWIDDPDVYETEDGKVVRLLGDGRQKARKPRPRLIDMYHGDMPTPHYTRRQGQV